MIVVSDIAQMITEDPDVFDEVLSENIEKLMPHLVDDAYGYIAGLLELAKDAGEEAVFGNLGIGPPPKSKKELNKYVENAVDLALQADPRYYKDHVRRGKPLKNVKAPFVKNILKWWLDPNSTDTLVFPEDIPIVNETLAAFNLAKQHGLTASVNDFDSYDALRRTLADYQTESGDVESDEYSRMGLELVFQDGPWKLYHIPTWIPGEESTMHKGETCHAAMAGTSWCVKYQHAWGPNSRRELYLLVKGGKRFALADFGSSREFKDPDNRPVGSPKSATATFDEGLDFLQRFLQDEPARELLFGRSNLGDFGRIYGEFLTPLLQQELERNPKIAIARLKNGEVEQGTEEALRPALRRLLANDPDFTNSLFANKRLGNLKVFVEDIRPFYREWLKSHPEHAEEIFTSKKAGDFYQKPYKHQNEDPVEKSKGTLLWELRPYFQRYTQANHQYTMQLLSSMELGDLLGFADILKPHFLQMLRAHPEFVHELWQKAAWRHGGVGDLWAFGDVLNPYFHRLNRQERTGDENAGATQLIFRKDYSSDPIAALLGDEPTVTSISMRLFGSDIVGDEDYDEETLGQLLAGEEVAYVISKEKHKGTEVLSYKPILLIHWNQDRDALWITNANEGNIDRFGPFLKDFFKSLFADPKADAMVPGPIHEKIKQFL